MGETGGVKSFGGCGLGNKRADYWICSNSAGKGFVGWGLAEASLLGCGIKKKLLGLG